MAAQFHSEIVGGVVIGAAGEMELLIHVKSYHRYKTSVRYS